MEARYIAIYKLLGVTKLPSDAKTLDLGALPNPNVNGNVKLTINPDAYCVDIDRSAALGLQFFKGPLGPEQNGTPQERLAAQVERARRDRVDRYGTGVFLVFEGASDIPSPDFKNPTRYGRFCHLLRRISEEGVPREIHAGREWSTYRHGARD